MQISSAQPRQISPATYRRICVVSLWALCAIVVTGAGVRLTGSGLGCTSWPTCADGKIVAPLEFHAMVEFINRMITGVVSVAVMLAVAGSLIRAPRRRDLTRWSLALVVGVVAQILIGAAVVISDLSYSLVGVHFLVSMGLVAAAAILVDRSGRPDDEPRRALPGWSKAIIATNGLVLLTGPIVTSSGPHAGARVIHGSETPVKRLPIALESAAQLHSASVWLFVLTLVVIAYRQRHSAALVRRPITDLLIVAVAQGGVGYLQYFTELPPLIVGLHVAGATLVWVGTLRVALRAAGTTTPSPIEPSPVSVS